MDLTQIHAILNQIPSAKLLDLQPVSHKDTALARQGHCGFSGWSLIKPEITQAVTVMYQTSLALPRAIITAVSGAYGEPAPEANPVESWPYWLNCSIRIRQSRRQLLAFSQFLSRFSSTATISWEAVIHTAFTMQKPYLSRIPTKARVLNHYFIQSCKRSKYIFVGHSSFYNGLWRTDTRITTRKILICMHFICCKV